MNIDTLGVISSAMGCGGSLIAYFSLYQKNDGFKQKVAREYVDRHDFDFGSEDEDEKLGKYWTEINKIE